MLPPSRNDGPHLLKPNPCSLSTPPSLRAERGNPGRYAFLDCFTLRVRNDGHLLT
ncbi:MAG: hypothetical protein LBT00_14975 [Spirochaetaceae bacterium]|nr:hypothetical protein [Spirochaetaceae bacterium]